MKIKKTLAIVMVAALSIGTLAGCSQATLDYSQELSKTTEWEALESNVEGSINIDSQAMKDEIKFTSTGYKNNDKSYVDIKFTDQTGAFQIPEIKAYCDGTTNYINKSYYEEIYKLSGQAIPEGLANIKEEYIGIDLASTGVDINRIKALSQPDGISELVKSTFGENNDLDLPFVKNGREYSLNLDSDKAVDLIAKAIKAANNNSNNTLKLGLPGEGESQAKAEANSSDFETWVSGIKAALTGSRISSKERFTDTTYNSDINVNLIIKDFGNVSASVRSSSAKSEAKDIDFPTSTLKITQEEFTKMLEPKNESIEPITNVVVK